MSTITWRKPTVVTSTCLLNNLYASMLLIMVRFISHKIKALLKPTPQKLDETLTVELANGKTENTDEIHIGCTLILNRFSFKSTSCPYLLVTSTKSLTWTV
jgi:hypothetical protein